MILSLPPGTKMFQFPGSTFLKLFIHFRITGVSQLGCPIRKSVDHGLFAATHSLSQLIASFFGSWCQGIHHALLLA